MSAAAGANVTSWGATTEAPAEADETVSRLETMDALEWLRNAVTVKGSGFSRSSPGAPRSSIEDP